MWVEHHELASEIYESQRFSIDQIRAIADRDTRRKEAPLIVQVLEHDPPLAADVLSGKADLPDEHGEPIAPGILLADISDEQLADLLAHEDREVRMKAACLLGDLKHPAASTLDQTNRPGGRLTQ